MTSETNSTGFTDGGGSLTSSMNMAVMGNTKLVVLVLLSMFTLEGTPTALRIVGVLIALAGIVWYAVFNVQEKQAAQKASEEAKKAEKEEESKKKPDESTPLKAS